MKKFSVRSQKVIDAYKALEQERKNAGKKEHAFNLSQENIIREFEHWVIIPNDFPYDIIFKTHHLLVPKRVFGHASEMNESERKELQEIKILIDPEYNSVLENLAGERSILNHYHLHVFVWREKF